MTLRRKEKIVKIVSVYLALNLIFEIISPSLSLALTGGPSQPEFESFEPAGTSEMVNVFSGDFNYNIPLMTVPGPNGGYPINLAYHAGVGMEQEASWVGLGWNLNAGEISRNVRGVPDDFNGDQIKHEISMRDDWNLSMKWTSQSTKEIFGMDLEKAGISGSLFYDSYRGVGFSAAVSSSSILGKKFENVSLPLEISIGSDDGIGMNVGLSGKYNIRKIENRTGLSFSASSRYGLTSIQVFTAQNLSRFGKLKARTGPWQSLGGSFFRNTYIPHAEYPMLTQRVTLGLELKDIGTPSTFQQSGTSADNTNYLTKTVKGSLVYQQISNNNIINNGFGYLYQQNAADTGLMDYNRGGDGPIKKSSPVLPTTSATYDNFSISGQGVGGAFRAMRNDIGIIHDPQVTGDIWGAEAVGEYGSYNPEVKKHFGLDAEVLSGKSYTGQWNNANAWDEINQLGYQDFSTDNLKQLNEPVYFRALGEMTATPTDQMNYLMDDAAVRFGLHAVVDDSDPDDISIKPRIMDDFLRTSGYDGASATHLSNYNMRGREKRTTDVTYRTNREIIQHQNYSSRPANISPANTFSSSSNTQFSYSSSLSDQIGEVTVLNPDGNRYVYGIPVYNQSQVDAVFSMDGTGENAFPSTVTYDPATDVVVKKNTHGIDNFVSKTTLPAYAHTYLISAVLGADYVDVDHNGPSENDLGYWVKFNYTKTASDYYWRYPYTEALLDKGKYYTDNDDKASYQYGQKDVYYLNSIETKTHIAKFFLNTTADRQDGLSSKGEHPSSSAAPAAIKSRYLDRIELYSVKSPGQVLKTVQFKYDYSLCANVPNNLGASVTDASGNPINTSKGKLTLKEVYVNYLGNTKGQLSPYKFNYGYNPSYKMNQVDRWGTYHADLNTTSFPAGVLMNTENPYVSQVTDFNRDGAVNQTDTDLRNNEAAAWCMTKITLPSGSDINIQYEADDYAYVQDKNAMQMCRLVGFTSKSDPPADLSSIKSTPIQSYDTRLIFELNKPLPSTATSADILPYVKQNFEIDTLYFKVFMKLMKKFQQTTYAWDYVDGFCRIDKTTKPNAWYGLTSTSSDGLIHFGYIDVQHVQIQGSTASGPAADENPVRKAGYQYLKLSCPDLFQTQTYSGIDLQNIVSAGNNLITNIQSIFGFYRMCRSRAYCNEISVDNSDNKVFAPVKTTTFTGKPSYVRLYNPDGHKYGGGHRVKKITVNDGWDAMVTGPETDFQYGQEYSYVLADGKSSGVCSYEPAIGGEENPFRMPNRYSDPTSLTNKEELYVLEPFGEEFFPGANVGYSRVISRSLKRVDSSNNEINTLSRSGYMVTEFYTARDFPLQRSKTDLQKTNFMLPLVIPVIGTISFNHKGYSQGFCIEMNDMHGRLKSTAVYPASANLSNSSVQPTAKTEYIYQTKSQYSSSHPNKLSSEVTVLDADGAYRQADIGKTYDFYVDMREHSNQELSIGAGFNVEQVASTALPITLPSIDYNRSLFRSVVNMKLIYRSGIVSEVRSYADGAMSVAKNLMYDAETGAPLLTQTLNNFDKPVYAYGYPSQWNYKTMGGAYHNIGARFYTLSGVSGGNFSISGASNYFVTGDEIVYKEASTGLYRTGYVTYIDPADAYITIQDQSGSGANIAASTAFKIVRSGYRNMPGVSTGTIIALDNPVTTGRRMPLFETLNLQSTLSSSATYTITPCSGNSCNVQLSELSGGVMTISKSPCNNQTACEAQIKFVSTAAFPSIPASLSALNGLDFILSGTQVKVVNSSGTQLYLGTWIDPNNCFPSCLNEVLHADAARFSDSWAYTTADYLDADISSTSASSISALNDYAAGRKGIWRTESNYLYQVNRKQSTSLLTKTDIAKDGTYEYFNIYNWNTSAPNNRDWSYVSSITRYSPYGYALESRDALGIRSAALVGYNSTKQVAAASNCSYQELGFDAFEDYGSSGTYTGHGHLFFQASSGPVIQSGVAHTGNASLKVSTGNDATHTGTVATTGTYFAPEAGEKYALSVWVKSDGSSTPSVEVNNGSTTVTGNINASEPAIEGWYQINLDFTAPASGTVTIKLKSTGGSYACFDDVRVQPFTSAMVSSVYDPNTHWLLAELDNRNFATLYQYDEEGAVIQVKKETEKGIMTISTGRSNIKRN